MSCHSSCNADWSVTGGNIALVGHPNVGKSVIFQRLTGQHAAVSNYPGTTVEIMRGAARQMPGFVVVDTPGVITFPPHSDDERVTEKVLLGENLRAILQVGDAKNLRRTLLLTVQLAEMGLPMALALNMMDEAARKGATVSSRRLTSLLGFPVVETIASRGVGIRELFAQVLRQLNYPPTPSEFLAWHRDIESAVAEMQLLLQTDARQQKLPSRFLAVKLLENDEDVAWEVGPKIAPTVHRLREQLEQTHGRPAEWVIMSERHDRAMRLAEESTTLSRPRSNFRAALDSLLTHPLWGYVFLIMILVLFFWGVFGLGSLIERALDARLALLSTAVLAPFGQGTFMRALVRSLLDGFQGGAGIVLPYLLPFLFGLAILEDVSYLPRVAYLMDGLLHRIGLHGTSMLPIVLGYGCSVPACMATRILPSRRDRFIASVLATLVPCSARSTVIFALVAFYLGPMWALGIFCFNALVVILSGWVLARLWPEISAGMVLEVPRYQWPTVRVLTRKVWLRLREFVVLSWPLLIAGSFVLGLATYWNLDHYVNAAFSPLTRLLGLPVVLGTTLIFGVLRKELALIMLAEALGTGAVAPVLPPPPPDNPSLAIEALAHLDVAGPATRPPPRRRARWPRSRA